MDDKISRLSQTLVIINHLLREAWRLENFEKNEGGKSHLLPKELWPTKDKAHHDLRMMLHLIESQDRLTVGAGWDPDALVAHLGHLNDSVRADVTAAGAFTHELTWDTLLGRLRTMIVELQAKKG